MASDAAEFTQLIRQFRTRRRRARGSKIAYAVYVALLVVLVYGGPAVVRAAKSINSAHAADPTTFRIEAAAPYGLVALALLVLTTLSRQALWRGPVVMSSADAAWLLPLPVSRRRLILPRYLASGVLSILVAVVLGLVGATVLHVYALGPIRQLFAISLIYAVSLALIGLGGAAAIERTAATAAVVRRARGGMVLLACGFAALAGLAASRSARMSTATLAHTFGLWPRIGVGLVAVASATYGALVSSDVPSVALRERAAVGTAISAAAYVGDFRRARLAADSATHGVRRWSFRLRPPRRASWSIPWRDLDNVMSTPGSIGWAAVWIALGAAAFSITARTSEHGRHEVFPLALAMLCGYVAAVPYTEPTRLDADDLRRIRWSPYPIRSLTARHAITPAVLAVIGQVLGAVFTLIWLGGRAEALAVCLAIATGPVLAISAMITAFRGAVPMQLVLGGPDFGFGPIGPAIAVFWYLLGPIAAMVLGALTALPVLHAYHSGSSAATAATIGSMAIGAGSSAVLVLGARARAKQRFAE